MLTKTDPVQQIYSAYKVAAAKLNNWDEKDEVVGDGSSDAYQNAQEPFVAAPTTSLAGAILKLQFISDEDAQEDTVDSIDRRVLSGPIRDLQLMEKMTLDLLAVIRPVQRSSAGNISGRAFSCPKLAHARLL